MSSKKPISSQYSPLKTSLEGLRHLIRGGKRLLLPSGKSPDEGLGDLFRLIQISNVYRDGKTFVDLVPLSSTKAIVKQYRQASQQPGFDLRQFAAQHFAAITAASHKEKLPHYDSPDHYIHDMWDILTRTNDEKTGTLLPLPRPYVVPGGRFSEQYYWDTYFTMLGLEATGRSDLTDHMIHNFQHCFTKFGFIPTANRTYYLSRSQPPFFLHMLELVAQRKGRKRTLVTHLPYLMLEYAYWTKDEPRLLSRAHNRYRRLVRMPDGSLLSRYYDKKSSPRPEMLRDDLAVAQTAADQEHLFRSLRAAAESGWDFSSRWFKDRQHLATIHTIDIVPIDLNCLLYQLELGIAETSRVMLQLPIAALYEKKAAKRRAAINAFMWNEAQGYYFDWDSSAQSQTTVWSLAGSMPLYAGIASHAQAKQVAATIREKFLCPGGVVATLHATGQQWDYPNSWAPLVWLTIVGLRRYGYHDLADEIKHRWIRTNEAVFARTNCFVEKYDVVHPDNLASGGEYDLQDGFGWSNGVYAALNADLDTTLATPVEAPKTI